MINIEVAEDSLSPKLRGSSLLLELKNESQKITFKGIDSKPVPALLRTFSAPVKTNYNYTNSDLIVLFRNDSDSFSRWDAGQEIFTRTISELATESNPTSESKLKNESDSSEAKGSNQKILIEAVKEVFLDEKLDLAYKTRLLTIPSTTYISQFIDVIDPLKLSSAREIFLKSMGHDLESHLVEGLRYLNRIRPPDFQTQVGVRALRGLILDLLMRTEKVDYAEIAFDLYKDSDNMSDTIFALNALNNSQSGRRNEALAHFKNRWRNDQLVMMKWFTIQATSQLPQTLEQLRNIEKSDVFRAENPNHVFSMHRAFAANNMACFHAIDGAGYRFIADKIIDMDRKNPLVAARLGSQLSQWSKFSSPHKEKMLIEINRIRNQPKLSSNLFEVIDRTVRA